MLKIFELFFILKSKVLGPFVEAHLLFFSRLVGREGGRGEGSIVLQRKMASVL